MKKLLSLVLAFGLVSPVFADGSTISSYTLTSETAVLQTKTSTTPINASVLSAIIVSSAALGSTGSLKIFNSSFTTSAMSTVTIVGLNYPAFYNFYDLRLKGIVYTTSGNANGVTILYKQ